MRRLRRHHGGDDDGVAATAPVGVRAVAAVSFSAAALVWCLGGGPQRAGLVGRLPLLQTSPPAALRQVPPRRVTLQVLAAEYPSLRRRSVPVISSESGGFVDLIVPEAALVTKQGRDATLAHIRPRHKLVCRGVWADAAKTTFRVAQVTLGPSVSSEELSRRVAAACKKVTARRSANRRHP